LAFFTVWAAVVLAFHQSVPARNVWYIYPAYPALALLAGGGLSEILGALRLRSPVLALAVGTLAGAYLTFGLERTWSAVQAPVQRSDPQRLADYLRDRDSPTVCQTAGSNLEAWDYFYLRPVLTEIGVATRWQSHCDYVITDEPWRVLPAGSEGGRVRWLTRFDLRHRPVALVSLGDELPPRVLALPERPEAALWGRVRLAGHQGEGALFISRHFKVRDRLRKSVPSAFFAGLPSRGAVVWHLVDSPFDYARIPLSDAWLPGGQEAALLVAGVGLAPVRLLLQPAPTAKREPQLVVIESERQERWTFRIRTDMAVEIEVLPREMDFRRDSASGAYSLALRVWCSPWMLHRLQPDSMDTRLLGVRLLAIHQAAREIWRLAEVPVEARGLQIAPEASLLP